VCNYILILRCSILLIWRRRSLFFSLVCGVADFNSVHVVLQSQHKYVRNFPGTCGAMTISLVLRVKNWIADCSNSD